MLWVNEYENSSRWLVEPKSTVAKQSCEWQGYAVAGLYIPAVCTVNKCSSTASAFIFVLWDSTPLFHFVLEYLQRNHLWMKTSRVTISWMFECVKAKPATCVPCLRVPGAPSWHQIESSSWRFLHRCHLSSQSETVRPWHDPRYRTCQTEQIPPLNYFLD